MPDYLESQMEFADFIFDCQKVVCYGLRNRAGGDTTVLNFPSLRSAEQFRDAFLDHRSFTVLPNGAQIVCLTDYDTLMRRSDDDPRVRCLNYSRTFMMGTLDHVM